MAQQSNSIVNGNTLKSIILQAIKNFLTGVIALGAVLFLPAWTLNYWQAWVFILVLALLLSLSVAYFLVKDAALIERRKPAARAAQTTGQRINIAYVYLAELGLLVLSALDHRFGWSHMPAYVSVIGIGLVILANVVWFYGKKENSFAGAGIVIYEGHKVISTGPYALVRHPNYAGDLTLIFGAPLALGSWWGLAFFVLMIPAMVWMIFEEERFLKVNLPGYLEYTQKVHYRLVPHIW
jgi:protein-S-isoprenylcysteine O-methyltransferase Ste14